MYCHVDCQQVVQVLAWRAVMIISLTFKKFIMPIIKKCQVTITWPLTKRSYNSCSLLLSKKPSMRFSYTVFFLYCMNNTILCIVYVLHHSPSYDSVVMKKINYIIIKRSNCNNSLDRQLLYLVCYSNCWPTRFVSLISV